MRLPASSAVSPYTTLFRSRQRRERLHERVVARAAPSLDALLENVRVQTVDTALPVVEVVEHLRALLPRQLAERCRQRSEEHTSELQSLRHLVCRLLLEKKK